MDPSAPSILRPWVQIPSDFFKFWNMWKGRKWTKRGRGVPIFLKRLKNLNKMDYYSSQASIPRTTPSPVTSGSITRPETSSTGMTYTQQEKQTGKKPSQSRMKKTLDVELFSIRRWATGLAQQSNLYGNLPCMCSIIYFGLVTNTTAHRLGRYSFHLLLLKCSMP